MPIFRRDLPAPPTAMKPTDGRPAGPSSRPAGSTLIAPGTLVSGEISGSTPLLVEGQVKGTMRLDGDVTIGQGGEAQGEISARAVRIGGKVLGTVRAEVLVEITPSGWLEGDVSAARVVIAEGAFFKGKVEMPGRGNPRGEGPGAAQRARAEPATTPSS
jgi:cytoskeletal protein CcmA (bactofilin family)